MNEYTQKQENHIWLEVQHGWTMPGDEIGDKRGRYLDAPLEKRMAKVGVETEKFDSDVCIWRLVPESRLMGWKIGDRYEDSPGDFRTITEIYVGIGNRLLINSIKEGAGVSSGNVQLTELQS